MAGECYKMQRLVFNIVCTHGLQYAGGWVCGRKCSNDEDSRTLAVITWSVAPHALARPRHNGGRAGGRYCNSWSYIASISCVGYWDMQYHLYALSNSAVHWEHIILQYIQYCKN